MSRGTKIHKALELSDISSLCPSDQRCADILMNKEAQYVDEHGFECAEQVRETRYTFFDPITDSKLYSAKIDVAYVGEDEALVLNYKTGFYTKKKPSYLQTACEAALVAGYYGLQHVLARTVTTNWTDPVVELFDSHENEEQTIDYWLYAFANKSALMLSGEGDYIVGDWCTSCPLMERNLCPKHNPLI